MKRQILEVCALKKQNNFFSYLELICWANLQYYYH